MSGLGNTEDRPGCSDLPRRKQIAIIGGGVSGATAARILTDKGHDVVVLDKGRGAGGRCSTRRNEVMEVDHGAQYFTVTDPRFMRAVEGWHRAGTAARWDARFVDIKDGHVIQAQNRERWVGVPTMSRIVSHLLQQVEVKYDTRVVELKKNNEGWWAQTDAEMAYGPFDDMVVALPAPQACDLLGEVSPPLAHAVNRVEMTPCWAVMVTFDRPLPLALDGARVIGHDSIAWVARNTSKPRRAQGPQETWVLHADIEWSSKHTEISREHAGKVLIEAFDGLCALQSITLPTVVQVRAHRWRYARTASPIGVACLSDDERAVTVCGDWLLGAKVEAAYLSGLAAAEQLHQRAISS